MISLRSAPVISKSYWAGKLAVAVYKRVASRIVDRRERFLALLEEHRDQDEGRFELGEMRDSEQIVWFLLTTHREMAIRILQATDLDADNLLGDVMGASEYLVRSEKAFNLMEKIEDLDDPVLRAFFVTFMVNRDQYLKFLSYIHENDLLSTKSAEILAHKDDLWAILSQIKALTMAQLQTTALQSALIREVLNFLSIHVPE